MRPKKRKNNNNPDGTAIHSVGVQRMYTRQNGTEPVVKEVIRPRDSTKYRLALQELNDVTQGDIEALSTALTNVHQYYYRDCAFRHMSTANEEFEIWALRDTHLIDFSAENELTSWDIAASKTEDIEEGEKISLTINTTSPATPANTYDRLVILGPNDNGWDFDMDSKEVWFNYPGEYVLTFYHVLDTVEINRKIVFKVNRRNGTDGTIPFPTT